MIRWLLPLVFAATVQAAVQDASQVTQGSFTPTPVASVAVGGNTLHVGRTKFRTMVVTMWNTAGTATAAVEINCTPSVATGWAPIATGSSLTVSTAVQVVTYPACDYRVNVTICSTCSVNANFFLGPEIQ